MNNNRQPYSLVLIIIFFLGIYIDDTTNGFTIPSKSSFVKKSNNNDQPNGKRSNNNNNNNKKSFHKKKNSNNNINNNRKTIGYSYRNEGIKIKRQKPPRWEVEGDSLFFLQDDNNDNDNNNDNDGKSYSSQQLDELFQSITREDNPTDSKRSIKNNIEQFLDVVFNKDDSQKDIQSSNREIQENSINKKNDHDDNIPSSSSSSSISSKTMWGTIPVGPILKSKLESIYTTQSIPTPIQQEAFKILSKKNKPNVVIASRTGSGKTLAFILPLLATTSKTEERKILIITPTLDLSFQIQKVVNQLWGDKSVYVMNSKSISKDDDIDSHQIMQWNIEEMLLSKAPIIASTPRILLQMVSTLSNSTDKRYTSIFSNLKTIVLDEADRLLQTELLARQNHDLKNNSNNTNNSKPIRRTKDTKTSKNVMNDCPTIQLLKAMERKMGVSLDVQQQQQRHSLKHPVQLICASATVGRTLRRQIMEITNASSIEKGSTLISADDRTGKDVAKRKSSLLPSSIRHLYVVTNTSTDEVENDDQDFINALLQSMDYLDSGSSIIFPGKGGVQMVADALKGTHGFQGVKTLRSSSISDDNIDQVENKNEISLWKDTPIYVIGEKFGRGLDIPNIKYVFISSPPVSPAAYAHLAGRTGRANQHGVAVTFVRDFKEAKRLFVLSNKLGMKFDSIDAFQCSHGRERPNSVAVNDDIHEHSDKEDGLHNLNVETLKSMLRERNLKVSGKKSELISRLIEDFKQ